MLIPGRGLRFKWKCWFRDSFRDQSKLSLPFSKWQEVYRLIQGKAVDISGTMVTKTILTSSRMSNFRPRGWLTNSETEWVRMNTVHWGMRELWQSSVRVPISHPAVRILDVGCGTGIWAKEIAEVLPRTQVMGVDLSPTVLPDEPGHRHPDNLNFEVHPRSWH